MNERQMSLDPIAIMADGIRWYGYLPKSGFGWSLGYFNDFIYGDHTRFMNWESMWVTRISWLPIRGDISKKLVYVGSSFRFAKPNNGKITVKSRPESNPAPYFINTGEFESDRTTDFGIEAYYRNGPLMFGSEFNFYHYSSTQAGNPLFWGGDVVASYILTGETRPYLTDNSVFFFPEPKKSLFRGGPGAWEVLLHLSKYDTNDGLKPGGSFWKFTPMVNWYISKNIRVEFVYGYGVLDRFNLKGATQFFQGRFQFQFM
jgi:phosphate-selective porin OprO/OprP